MEGRGSDLPNVIITRPKISRRSLRPRPTVRGMPVTVLGSGLGRPLPRATVSRGTGTDMRSLTTPVVSILMTPIAIFSSTGLTCRPLLVMIVPARPVVAVSPRGLLHGRSAISMAVTTAHITLVFLFVLVEVVLVLLALVARGLIASRGTIGPLVTMPFFKVLHPSSGPTMSAQWRAVLPRTTSSAAIVATTIIAIMGISLLLTATATMTVLGDGPLATASAAPFLI